MVIYTFSIQKFLSIRHNSIFKKRVEFIMQIIKKKNFVFFFNNLHNKVLKFNHFVRVVTLAKYKKFRPLILISHLIKLKNLSVEESNLILIAKRNSYEKYYHLKVSNKALKKVVKLSKKCVFKYDLTTKVVDCINKVRSQLSVVSHYKVNTLTIELA
mgnify:CR=1 FL=1